VGTTQADHQAEWGYRVDGIAAVYVGFDYVQCEDVQV
tara:strand:- start:3589 stop:3699 length:111 start_codon:yes stop_codon:yes gene_type:complete